MRDLGLFLRAPITAGALRGRWWCPAGGGKVWRVLGGTYEPVQTAEFSRRSRPGMVVMDLGAHLGYYTLLASTLVGDGGRVFAFEPHPRNASVLRRHVRINRCTNVEVLERAVLDGRGRVSFGGGTGSGTNRVRQGGAHSVDTICVDEFAEERGISPELLKIDVEGAERRVLDGAARTLRETRPIVLLSTHGDGVRAECRSFLDRAGYVLVELRNSQPDPDYVCLPEETAGVAATSAVA